MDTIAAGAAAVDSLKGRDDLLSANHTADRASMRNVFIFTVAVLALSWVARWVESVVGGPLTSGAATDPGAAASGGLGMAIWIASPLVVSFLLRAFAGDGWRDLGAGVSLRGEARWYAVSLVLYPAAAIIVLGINHWSGEVSAGGREGLFLQTLLAALLPQLLQNVLEESGFRGYLTPKLAALGVDRLLNHAIVGLIWGAWHLPFLRTITFYTNESLVTLAPRFLLGTVAASIVYGEIRLRTNSVWPAIIMQTSGGAFIGALVAAGHIPWARYAWLRTPTIEGGFMLAMFGAFGLWLYARAREREREAGTDEA